MTERSSVAVRLSLFYAALFGVVGVQLPFWPLYLSAKGMTAAEIGQMLAAAYFVRVVTNPLVGHAADRRGERRPLLIALAAVSLSSTACFAPADGFAWLMIVTLVSSAAFTAMMPLGDALTLQSAAAHRLDYGRLRLWGSLSFIAVSGLAGLTLVDAPRSAILLCCLATLAFTLVAAWLLPEAASRRPNASARPIWPWLKHPTFVLFLAASSATQVSHMIYYGFATLYWRQAGLSGAVIGGLWAESVIAEVVLFACSARLVGRFGPGRLLASAGLAGVIRWSVLAATTDPWILAGIQTLHALTFAAGHLGAMHFIYRAAPPAMAARAQGIYASVSMGLVPGLAMLVSGSLYQRLGANAFLVMSAFAACGFVLSLRLLKVWSGGLRFEAHPPSDA
jgi:PPP family 3-phenylpropionic acid transporter